MKFTTLILLAFSTAAQVLGGNRVLVLSHKNEKDASDTLSKTLQGIGYDVSSKTIENQRISLSTYGEYLFDTVIVIPSDIAGLKEGSGHLLDPMTQGISEKHLVDFVDAGGNLMIAASKKLSKEMNAFIHQFSMNIGSGGSDLTLKLAKEVGPFKFKQSATLTVSDFVPVSKSKTTVKVESLLNTDSNNSLVSAMQAGNDARVTVLGSTELLTLPAAQPLISQLVDWTAKRSHFIRIVENKVHHRLAVAPRGTPPQRMYREGLDLHAEFALEERKGDSWVPFFGPLETNAEGVKGVPVEFVLLDPYIRTLFPLDTQNVTDAQQEALYSKTFRIPDKCGIFKFAINFKPGSGYNQLHHEQVLPIRNFRHNDFPRMQLSALPYYSAEISTLLLTVIFTVVFLFHKEDKNQGFLQNISSSTQEPIQNLVKVSAALKAKYLKTEEEKQEKQQ